MASAPAMLGAAVNGEGQWGQVSSRRRAAGVAVTIAFHILLIILFIRLAPPLNPPGLETSLTIIPLPPAPEVRAARKTAHAAQRTVGGAPPKPAESPPPPVTRPNPAAPWVVNPELAGFDLSQGRKPTPSLPAPAATDAEGTGSGSGSGSGSADDAGQAPGGGRLYSAQWYREPSHAELSTYLPRHGAMAGWGDIACRTIERYHVEDCRELDESPAGSGFARAAREAAFQFLVRPPRLNGKVMVGAWVRIHIEITAGDGKGG